jgi:nucleotide-binding universal stress UspA family protein
MSSVGLESHLDLPAAWQEERPGVAAMTESARTPGFRHVLVALDGSAASTAVVPDAVALARHAEGSVVLAQVLPPGSPDAAVSAARARLGRLATAIEAEGIAATTVLLEGAPAEQIVGFVAGNDIDLVALGSHGAWGDDGGLHGSVADTIIRQSPVPTLVRRAPAGQPTSSAARFQRLLVPLDGSPLAERAVPHALALAKATGGQVLLVQSVADVRSFRDGGSATLIARELRAADEYLASLRERYRSAGVPLDITVRLGRPAETIRWVAQETGADLVVMATHGRSGLRRERMGSVALAVLQGSLPLLLLGSSVTTATEAGRPPARRPDISPMWTPSDPPQ